MVFILNSTQFTLGHTVVWFHTSQSQRLHIARQDFCCGPRGGVRTCRKVLALDLSLALFTAVLSLLCRQTTLSLRWTAWYLRSMCTNTMKTNGAAETHTSECCVLMNCVQRLCWGLFQLPRPTKSGSQPPCFFSQLILQRSAQLSYGNRVCSSAPGGLRPIGLQDSRENLSITQGLPTPNLRTPLHKPNPLSRLGQGNVVWVRVITQKASVTYHQLCQHIIWRVSF